MCCTHTVVMLLDITLMVRQTKLNNSYFLFLIFAVRFVCCKSSQPSSSHYLGKHRRDIGETAARWNLAVHLSKTTTAVLSWNYTEIALCNVSLVQNVVI